MVTFVNKARHRDADARKTRAGRQVRKVALEELAREPSDMRRRDVRRCHRFLAHADIATKANERKLHGLNIGVHGESEHLATR